MKFKNRRQYTAEQFAQDITAVLPFVLLDLQELGVMTTCANCGKPFDGASFAVRGRKLADGETEVEIVAICIICGSKAAMHPNDWAHVSESSGLYPGEHEWATLVQAFRSLAVIACMKAHGGLIYSTSDTP